MQRITSLVAAIGCVALALAGCTPGRSARSPKPATLIVWADSAREPAVHAAADAYTKATGLPVDVETHEVAGSAEEIMAAADQDEALPDVLLTSGDWTAALAQHDLLSPVDLGSKLDGFVSPALKAATYDGKLYALPVAFDNLALIRNTDLVTDPPKDFDTLLRSAEDLLGQKRVESVVGLGDSRPGTADPYYLYPLQASFGAPLFARMDQGSFPKQQLAMGGSEGGAFAAYLDRMARSKDYDAGLTADAAVTKFRAGKLAYMIAGPSVLPELKKSGVKYAVEQIPSAGGQPATPLVTEEGFVVTAASKHPIDAQRFLTDYLSGAQIQTDMAKAVARNPANEEALRTFPDADLAAFARLGIKGVPMPASASTSELWYDWATTESTLLTAKSNDPVADWKTMCDGLSQKLK